tara:strand:- start:1066 stop:3099 length:2034 start_codon:yes stop_codon:yes gene_type:complete
MQDFLFPPELSQEVRDNRDLEAEVMIFDFLAKQIEKEKLNLVVFHDNAWTKPKKNKDGFFWGDGQSDFIIFSEKFGIINFEIKGGIISYEKGKWFTTHRFSGNKFELDKSPISQTRNNKYDLKDIIYKELNKLEDRNVYNFSNFKLHFQHAVAFPHTPYNETLFSRADTDKRFIFTEEDNEKIASKLNFLIQDTVVNNEPGYYQAPGTNVLNILKNKFNRDFTPSYSRSRHIEIINSRLKDAEKNLHTNLEMINPNPKALFCGGAGSGKTFMAVEKAKELTKEKNNKVLFLASNPNFISVMQGQYDLPESGNLEVSSPQKLLDQILQKIDSISTSEIILNGMKELFLWNFPPLKDDFSGPIWEEKYIKKLNSAIEKIYDLKKETKDYLYTHIIIDEAQDFSSDFFETISLLLENSPEGLFAFMDNNQRIATKNGDDLEKYFINKSFPILNLEKNYRNTKKIFNLGTQFYSGHEMECLGPQGIEVSFVIAKNVYEIQQKVIAELERLKQDGISDIAVLQGDDTNEKGYNPVSQGTGLYLTEQISSNDTSGKNYSTYPFLDTYWEDILSGKLKEINISYKTPEMAEEMGEAYMTIYPLMMDAKIGNFPVFPSSQTSLNIITYDRVINFKGLEKEVIILVDIDKSMDIEEDIYVGLTRAKAELIIISGKRCIDRLKTLSF